MLINAILFCPNYGDTLIVNYVEGFKEYKVMIYTCTFVSSVIV